MNEPHVSHQPVTQPTGYSNPTGQAPTIHITGYTNETGYIQRFQIGLYVETHPIHERPLSWEHFILSDSSLDHDRPPATKYRDANIQGLINQ